MAEPFVGEIRWLAYEVNADAPPAGWVPCDGRVLDSDLDSPLYSLIQNSYGGQFPQFAVPDLRGRVPLHRGGNRTLAQPGGQERVALTVAQLPAHNHLLGANSGEGDRGDPAGNVWARSEALGFSADAADAAMGSQALASTGADAPHDNMMPFLGLTALISRDGVAPGEEPAAPDAFMGEIRMMAFPDQPLGWLHCDGGALLLEEELAVLVGDLYSHDASNPTVPDLRARVPIHRSDVRQVGRPGGEEAHTLSPAELPPHTHAAMAAPVPGDDPSPSGRHWGVQSAGLAYAVIPDTSLRPDAVATAGLGMPHDNLPPYLALNCCVSRTGIFPATMDQQPISDPFLGEVRLFAFKDFAPMGWAICDGTLLERNEQTEALALLLGTRFGGDGITNFALPDLRGRALLAAGAGPGLTPRTVAERGGADAVVLTLADLPTHTHEVRVRGNGGGASSPENNVFGASQARALSAGYSSIPAVVPMAAAAVGPSGGGQPHENMPPYLPVSFCISLNGTIP